MARRGLAARLTGEKGEGNDIFLTAFRISNTTANVSAQKPGSMRAAAIAKRSRMK